MAFKIYTKTGDAGETGLYGGQRVPKDHVRINAYGTVDELNSQLGLLSAHVKTETPEKRAGLHEDALTHLLAIQSKLFTIGSQLATPPPKESASAKTLHIVPVGEVEVAELERAIDRLDKDLQPLSNFILPTGSLAVAQAHVCRTVARRAERCVVALDHVEPVAPQIIVYLNRLSDYLFTLSRGLAAATGQAEHPWVPLAS